MFSNWVACWTRKWPPLWYWLVRESQALSCLQFPSSGVTSLCCSGHLFTRVLCSKTLTHWVISHRNNFRKLIRPCATTPGHQISYCRDPGDFSCPVISNQIFISLDLFLSFMERESNCPLWLTFLMFCESSRSIFSCWRDCPSFSYSSIRWAYCMPLLGSVLGYGICSRFGYYNKVTVGILGFVFWAPVCTSHWHKHIWSFLCWEWARRGTQAMSSCSESEDFLSQSSQGVCVTLSSHTHCVVPHPLWFLILVGVV